MTTKDNNRDIISHWYCHSFSDCKPSKAGVICMVDGRCLHGGFADRLRGCLSVYSVCQQANVPFYIHWNYPFDLRKYLMPKDVDWTIAPEDIVYDTSSSLVSLIFVNGLIWGENWFDRRYVNRVVNSPLPQKHVYSNADFACQDYLQLFHKLFKPTPFVEALINECQRQIGAKYYSYTFRFQNLLGDFDESDTCKTLEAEEQRILMARCKDEMLKLLNHLPTGHKILVTADSVSFLQYVQAFDSRIYVIPGQLTHFNRQSSNNTDTYVKSFVDFYMLTMASKLYLLVTGDMYESGFPRFAALVGKKRFVVHRF